jgi:predicted metal-dependent hydrolase
VKAARAARDAEGGATMDRLRRLAAELARKFGLRCGMLEAERDGVNAHYGICYSDGLIRIRLRHAVTGRLLKESSLVDTLCHELAHLRHFDHSPAFKEFYLRILEEARRRGDYRPGPEWRQGQGSLFGSWTCETGGAALRAQRERKA